MKKLIWKLEVVIEVAEEWVADGYEPHAERVERELKQSLPYAYGHELSVKAKVLTAPKKEVIQELQGYKPKKERKMSEAYKRKLVRSKY